jgi:hypothetical protein
MSLLDGNSQKTPLAQSLQKLGAAKAQDAVAALGKGLPCTVASVQGPGIVTVNFAVEITPPLGQMMMPVNKPKYIKYPIQVGDIGVALSAGLRTGGLTGLGVGVPSLYDTVGNLSAMTFFWLGSTSEEFLDSEALDLYSNILCTPTELAFYGGSKVSKRAVEGTLSAVTDPNAKAVLTSLIAALTASGVNLFTDDTT